MSARASVALRIPKRWLGWAGDLFAPRTRRAMEVWDWVVWWLYAAMLAWGIHHHLASDDESQAWLLARDSGLGELLFRRLHYEGAPGLWPILMWSAARLRMPFASIQWISGTFALIGTGLLLRFAPFGRVFRWVLPFTFFLGYQYAVIARPYALLAPLLWLMCVIYSLERPRPLWFAVVTGLMANISLHSAMLAGFFSLLYLRRVYKQSPRRQVAGAVGVFAVLACFAAVVAFPAPDVAMAGKVGSPVPARSGLLVRLMPPEKLPVSAPPLDSFLRPDTATAAENPSPKWLEVVVKTIIVGADAACFPIAKSNLLAVAVLVSFLWWLNVRGCLGLALPFALTIVLSAQIWIYDHHAGQFLLAIVAAVWIAFDTTRSPQEWSRSGVVFGSLALVAMALQVGWTVHCLRAETTMPYDAGLATERYLAANFAGKRVAGFSYESVSAEPYASGKLYFNQPHAYWVWSAPVWIDQRRTEALQQQPDAVVIADVRLGGEFLFNQWGTVAAVGAAPNAPMLQYWEENGYRVDRRFCGDRVMRGGMTNETCEVVLVPQQSSSYHPPPAAP